jgi:cytochrome oxidase Cu insertion factor (SCO1/SenC/PrrC family)
MRFIASLVLTGGVILTTLPAADPASEEKAGLKVGAKAPAFALKDQAGKERTLDEFRKGDGFVAVVFYRSASW